MGDTRRKEKAGEEVAADLGLNLKRDGSQGRR